MKAIDFDTKREKSFSLLQIQGSYRFVHPAAVISPCDVGIVDVKFNLVNIRIFQVDTLTDGMVGQPIDRITDFGQSLVYILQPFHIIADFQACVIQANAPPLQRAGGIAHLYQQQLVMGAATAEQCAPSSENVAFNLKTHRQAVKAESRLQIAHTKNHVSEFTHGKLVDSCNLACMRATLTLPSSSIFGYRRQ